MNENTNYGKYKTVKEKDPRITIGNEPYYYIYIDSDGDFAIGEDIWMYSPIDELRNNVGNIFKRRKDAEYVLGQISIAMAYAAIIERNDRN